ncbi:MAG: hypothetical protein IJU40_05075, partial [Desulfovibrionaceae bacterium]|nr:hypothetical protein [Desulfovibrionaceae bacterium]
MHLNYNSEIDDIIQKINLGHAVLFTGAAFSQGCINNQGKNLPLSKDLAKIICAAGNFPESENLMFASQKFISRDNNELENKNQLISLLKQLYTVKVVSESVKKICKAPWNKFYTTNYDDAIEKSN